MGRRYRCTVDDGLKNRRCFVILEAGSPRDDAAFVTTKDVFCEIALDI